MSHRRYPHLASSILWLFVIGLGVSHPVHALPAHDAAMKRAIQLYDQLQFPQALAILIQLARQPELTRKERARAYLYQGFCMFYVQTPKIARRKFRVALKFYPQLRLPPETPPPLRRLVVLERTRLGIKPPTRPRPALALQLKPKAPQSPGQPITFEGTCTRRPFGARLFIKVRRLETSTFQEHRLQWKGTSCSGQIPNPYPADHTGQSTILYVFQARRGLQVLATSPALSAPTRFSWSTRTKRPLPPIPTKSKSNTGLIVGVTVGIAAAIGGGVALTLILLNQPSGPSIKVQINITPTAN